MSIKSVIALSFIVACLPAAMCQPKPVVPPPVAVGGVAQSGGGSALGGASVVTAGTSSTGGTSSVETTTTPLRWLACNTAKKATNPVKRSLSGWRPDKQRAIRARVKPSYRISAGSVFNQPNLATPLDQGSLGSCTGNATAHCLSTWPFVARLAESDAVSIYSLATTLDAFAGVYPPTDTGSSGSAAAVAAKRLGYTTLDFGAVDTTEGLQVALQSSSCIIGSDWFTGFFSPSLCGEVGISGRAEGGHEYQVIAWDADRKIFIARNSWGPTFGVCRDGNPNECGYFYMSAGTMTKLLSRGAEIDCPIL